jgi:hypothetical protein
MHAGFSRVNFTRLLLRAAGWLLASVLLLLGIAALLISTPWGNDRLRDVAQSWLRKKLQTELSIGKLRIHGLQGVSLFDLMVKDRQQDTLVSLDTLSISFRLGQIVAKKIDIPQVRLAGLHTELRRPANSDAFNFQFIVDAFASGTPDTDTIASSPWDIHIGDLRLDRTSFLWDDGQSGDYYRAALHTLDLPMKQTDFAGMQFRAGKAMITGLDTEIRMGKAPVEKEQATKKDEVPPPFRLTAEGISLVDTRFALDNVTAGLTVRSKARDLSLDKISYDLASAHASGGVFVLEDHETSVQYRPAAKASKAEPKDTNDGTGFSLSLDSISVERTGLAIDDVSAPRLGPKQFDPQHIHFQDMRLKAADIGYDSSGYRARVWDLAYRDANGVDLKRAAGDLFFSDTALYARNLVLKTAANSVEGSMAMSYASIEKMMSSPATTRVSLDLLPSVIRLDELAYFVPDIASNKSLASIAKQDIKLRAQARGSLDDLVLSEYRVETGGSLLRGQALLLHPTVPQRLEAQASITELSSSRKSLQLLVPRSMVPDSVWLYIPERFTISGRLAGSMRTIRPDLTLNSSDGNLTLKGTLDNPTNKERATYDLTINTPGYNLGRTLGDSALGMLAGTAAVKGQGFNPETLAATFDVSLREVGFRGYTYSGIDLHGQMDHGDINANLSSAEPNLDLDAELALHYGQPISNVNLTSDIRQLDLHALGFSDSLLAIKGHADIHFPILDSSKLDGTAMLDDIVLQMGSRTFRLDTISVNAHTALDSQYITVRSPLADVDIKGHFSVNAIPGAASTILDNWLVPEGELKAFPEPVYAELQANVHIPDSLAPIVPGLKSVAPFMVVGGIDTRQNTLLLSSVLPRVQYREYLADSITLLLMQIDTIARYKQSRFVVQVKHAESKSFSLYRSLVGGQISKGVIDGQLVFYNAKEEVRYRVPIKYVNDPGNPYVNIPDSLMLNGKRWEVNSDNRVYISPDKLKGSNLVVSQGAESIALKADLTHSSGLPLSLDIRNLRLESLTGMLVGETQLLKGTANGTTQLNSLSPTTFQSDLRIDSLALFGSAFGNLHTAVEATASGRYDMDVSLKGAGNDFTVTGNIAPTSGDIDLHVKMAPLNLEPLAPFAEIYVDSARGGLRGDLVIGGNMKKPDIDGRLELDSAYMIVRQTGTPLYVPNASLLFNGQQISFQGMTLLDSAGRPATITGTGRAENLTDITYDLKVQSAKFLVSGRKRYEEQLVSGPLYAGMLLNIRGDLQHADINGNVNIIDSSEISYVYKPDISSTNGEGLIEFFDPNRADSTDSLVVKSEKKTSSGFQLAVSSYIRLSPASTVSIVLDEVTGDQLSARGTANLNFTMDPGGAMELTGNYEVESGAYNLTIGGLLKKSFYLQKGSTITWTGDILKANTDLTAKYTVRTDAEELLQEVETIPGAGRQKFDFEVYMMIKGELLKPAISFRLDMPPKEQSAFNGTVYTRLRQVNSVPSELNKQVMGLLALNSFIADNPFNSLTSGGESFETQAFATAGRLLTQELNDFLGSVIKDVDIDIGLDIRDDYTTGEAQRRSDLKVGFTKSLAHNRLNIYVGNTFALEQHNQNTNAMAGLAGDVSIEYLLTSDGKYRLKGYRLTEEDLTFNGIVVETGLTFVVVLEFNKFKNAFRSKKKKMQVHP